MTRDGAFTKLTKISKITTALGGPCELGGLGGEPSALDDDDAGPVTVIEPREMFK